MSILVYVNYKDIYPAYIFKKIISLIFLVPFLLKIKTFSIVLIISNNKLKKTTFAFKRLLLEKKQTNYFVLEAQ